MSMLDSGLQSARSTGPTARRGAEQPSGAGWLLFAGVMLLIVAILNIIYPARPVLGERRSHCTRGAS
jgi:hypothetical protein